MRDLRDHDDARKGLLQLSMAEFKRSSEIRRTFAYSKEIPTEDVNVRTAVNLSFSLRIDTKEEMLAFREMLAGAVMDVNEQLEKTEKELSTGT